MYLYRLYRGIPHSRAVVIQYAARPAPLIRTALEWVPKDRRILIYDLYVDSYFCVLLRTVARERERDFSILFFFSLSLSPPLPLLFSEDYVSVHRYRCTRSCCGMKPYPTDSSGVVFPLKILPEISPTHVVLSIGGNDARLVISPKKNQTNQSADFIYGFRDK